MTILASLTVIFGYISWLLVRKGGVWNHGTESDYSLDQNMPVNTVKKTQVPTATTLDTNTLSEAPSGSSAMLWDTPKQAYHSTRLICDEMGLMFTQKEIVSACVFQESGFLINPRPNQNKDKKGKVWSTDWGIVQVNDYWQIGAKKTFPSVEYVLANPEKCIRWMVGIMKTTGKLQPWASYTSGAYKKWLVDNSPMRKLAVV